MQVFFETHIYIIYENHKNLSIIRVMMIPDMKTVAELSRTISFRDDIKEEDSVSFVSSCS